MADEPDLVELLQELIDIGIALTTERSMPVLLGRILSEARRITRAEAGTLFFCEGDQLRFAVTQNDVLEGRLSSAELNSRYSGRVVPVDGSSLAGWAALRNEIVNVPDAYTLAPDAPYMFNAVFDAQADYQTHSVLAVPLRGPHGPVIGVLQLINALDDKGRIVPFHRGWEPLVRALSSLAAVALDNVRVHELSYRDALTGLYNRSYFTLRMEEELRRHARFGHPLSLVLVEVGGADDYARRAMAATLVEEPARGFSVTSRHDADTFAALLADTNKLGALEYARRVLRAVGRRGLAHGDVTVSIGVAALPEDAATNEELLRAADRALYRARQSGAGVTAAGPGV
ncbi:MAG TPA: sensor domain-containing diguanylate cyclase [Methylomirabilota bacterium]